MRARAWPVSPGYQWRVYPDGLFAEEGEEYTDDDGQLTGEPIRGGWAPTKRAARERIAEVRADG